MPKGWSVVKSHIDKRTKTRLAKNHACYILITCNAAQADGNMHVEMTYEGDPALAACLLDGAQTLLDEDAGAYCDSHFSEKG